MKKFSSFQTVFYVTNVCNFNCQDCNSYNNYHFSGVTKWRDVAETYAKWSEIFDPGYWEVCGGEIMTSPDWLDWVKGVNDLWPNHYGRILTNGSLFDKNKDKLDELYTIMAKSDGKIQFRISLHDRSRFDETFAWIKDFLGPSWHPHSKENFEGNFINSYNRVKADHWPNLSSMADWYNLHEDIQKECLTIFNICPDTEAEKQTDDWQKYLRLAEDTSRNYFIGFSNSDKVNIILSSEDTFYKSSVQYDSINKEFTIHRSNPNIAHDNCQEKCFKKGLSVPVFFNGELYKCLHSKLFSDLDKQYDLPITEEERTKINSYRPASLDMTTTELIDWFEKRNDVIYNCTFCPENYVEKHHIVGNTKKIFIKKKPKRQ